LDRRPKPFSLQMAKVRPVMTPLFNRLVLIPERRRRGPSAPLRRYRLARIDLRERPPADGDRFAHLKRVYD
jgi:hypothetical protein